MDYEKEYKKLKADIEKAYLFAQTDSTKSVLEHILTELRESEDERIRKEIIAILQYKYEKFSEDPKYCNAPQWIDWLEKQGEQTNPYSGVSFEYNGHIWGMCARDNGVDILLDKQLFKHLEKQGEQKPTDKVEPKFHKGEWVVDEDDNYVYQIERVIENVTSGNFSYDLVGGGYFPSTKKNYHLWTIQDAKDGDVLYSPEHNLLWIYKNKEECHAAVNLNYANSISFGSDIVIPSDAQPATKLQCDYIFSKMHESGYECDDKEKVVKEVENIWHNYNDQIDVDKTILIIAPNGNSSLALWNGKALLSKTLGGGHNVLCEGDKWAYIEDLIKTQKVV